MGGSLQRPALKRHKERVRCRIRLNDPVFLVCLPGRPLLSVVQAMQRTEWPIFYLYPGIPPPFPRKVGVWTSLQNTDLRVNPNCLQNEQPPERGRLRNFTPGDFDSQVIKTALALLPQAETFLLKPLGSQFGSLPKVTASLLPFGTLFPEVGRLASPTCAIAMFG